MTKLKDFFGAERTERESLMDDRLSSPHYRKPVVASYVGEGSAIWGGSDIFFRGRKNCSQFILKVYEKTQILYYFFIWPNLRPPAAAGGGGGITVVKEIFDKV